MHIHKYTYLHLETYAHHGAVFGGQLRPSPPAGGDYFLRSAVMGLGSSLGKGSTSLKRARSGHGEPNKDRGGLRMRPSTHVARKIRNKVDLHMLWYALSGAPRLCFGNVVVIFGHTHANHGREGSFRGCNRARPDVRALPSRIPVGCDRA